ncbi:MAG: transglutaminase domain-containing protein [Bacilli bacterium]
MKHSVHTKILAAISSSAMITLMIGSRIVLGPETPAYAKTAAFPARPSAIYAHKTTLPTAKAGKRTTRPVLLAFETKGSFAQWAMATFAHRQSHSMLPRQRYRDVPTALLRPLGQAVALGVVLPDASHYFGVQDRLSRGVAAQGIVRLLRLDTHGVSPYLYAVSLGWFKNMPSGVWLRRAEMFTLAAHVRQSLSAQRTAGNGAHPNSTSSDPPPGGNGAGGNQPTTAGPGSSSAGGVSATGGTGSAGDSSAGAPANPGASTSGSTPSGTGATGAGNLGSTSSGSSGTAAPGSSTPYVIPAVPASGELPLSSAPSAADVAANSSLHTVLPLQSPSSANDPVQLQDVIFNPGNPNIVVSGVVKEASGTPMPSVAWIQINDLGLTSGNPNQWNYAVPVSSSGTFADVLQIPFSADVYEVQAAPPLTTAQTSLNYMFATKQQTVSSQFTMTFQGQDSNQQLGMLASAWADWTDPAIQALASQITKGISSPLAQAQAVYNWEGQHIGYNGALLANGGYGWSTTQETFSSGIGICVDYANVADALMRSLGIPTQMVVGYANNGAPVQVDNPNDGHAWNRSWIGNEWIYWDPTWARLYFVASATQIPGPGTPWSFQPQWFNPSAKVFNSTHQQAGIQYQ